MHALPYNKAIIGKYFIKKKSTELFICILTYAFLAEMISPAAMRFTIA